MATTKATTLAHNAEIIDDLGEQSVPHIIPGVLYPAVSGNDLSGTALGGSYVYGTAHTDGRKYYYTDIKGSKPIKDPRIGGHFGSQRHVFSSLQLLEQETATEGNNIYAVDGREWCRLLDASGTSKLDYGGQGHRIQTGSTSDFLEVVGYFSHVNVIDYKTADVRRYAITVDGGTEGGNSTSPSVTNPLWGRYVNAGSVENYDINKSLGIHTLKIRATGTATYPAYFFGIELIAQDTTSTANRSKIQIPSQDVVSYGKKFNISGTPHYDPFNGFTSGSSVTSYIDTATSLGVENWKESSTYYRPYNGMRVIKWVDSSGTIKTSVTVMPPLAKSIADSNNLTPSALSDNITAASANSEYRPYFGQNDAYDAVGKEPHGGLHEVAKTFHWREFGNGSANGNSSYLDVTTISSTSDVAFVMDDGLTSFAGDDVNVSSYDYAVGSTTGTPSGDLFYITFIGTGLTLSLPSSNATEIGTQYTIAQNLPYGTHVYKQERSGSNGIHTIDGVVVATSAPNGAKYITFHQPKRPPIPEDACVIADYMLMADTVHIPDNTSDITTTGLISKGVRRVSASRDFFYNGATSLNALQMYLPHTNQGLRVYHVNTDASKVTRLPYFGNGITFLTGLASSYNTNANFKINGTLVTTSSTGTNHSGSQTLYSHTSGTNGFSNDNNGTFTCVNGSLENGAFVGVTGINLGVNEFQMDAGSGYVISCGADIDTPIHTSSHYQTFEAPFLNELVGGDRNMEQHNLVVSPDGKSWDEVTRDTSYIGKSVLFARSTSDYTSNTSLIIMDEWRGVQTGKNFYNKDCFAIAYDRIICLKDGEYHLFKMAYSSSAGDKDIQVNGVVTGRSYGPANDTGVVNLVIPLKRGDYIILKGVHHTHVSASYFWIKKV